MDVELYKYAKIVHELVFTKSGNLRSETEFATDALAVALQVHNDVQQVIVEEEWSSL